MWDLKVDIGSMRMPQQNFVGKPACTKTTGVYLRYTISLSVAEHQLQFRIYNKELAVCICIFIRGRKCCSRCQVFKLT